LDCFFQQKAVQALDYGVPDATPLEIMEISQWKASLVKVQLLSYFCQEQIWEHDKVS
jgi:hypothetical protein